MMSDIKIVLGPLAALLLGGCMAGQADAPQAAAADESADAFVERLNEELTAAHPNRARTAWVAATYITPDTNALVAASTAEQLAWVSQAIEDSKRYVGEEHAADTARMLRLLQIGSPLPAPRDPAKQQELAEIVARMEAIYGSGKYCPDGAASCKTLPELERVLAENRDYDAQLAAWLGWRTVSPAMRDDYKRFVELTNEGARELGYKDTGHLWRAGYDMDPDAFYEESDRLWGQVKPLYDQLHCHVRATLNERYGDEKVPADGAIPAHLLGNMWAQSWDNLYPLLEPYEGVSNLDVDAALVEQGYDDASLASLPLITTYDGSRLRAVRAVTGRAQQPALYFGAVVRSAEHELLWLADVAMLDDRLVPVLGIKLVAEAGRVDAHDDRAKRQAVARRQLDRPLFGQVVGVEPALDADHVRRFLVDGVEGVVVARVAVTPDVDQDRPAILGR